MARTCCDVHAPKTFQVLSPLICAWLVHGYKEYICALAFCLWPCLAVALQNLNILNILILDPVNLNKTGFKRIP